MKRQTIIELGAFVGLLVLGIGMRVLLEGMPNVAPVAAVALFAGYFFRSWRVALGVPLLVMALSDLWIGGYEWSVLLPVYASIAFPVLMRPLLRGKLRLNRPTPGGLAASVAKILACSLGASVVFFLLTNFAVWLTWYEPTFAGFARCYLQALPFFRYTLTGDMLFAAALFGGYSLALNFAPLPQPAADAT